MPYLLEPLSVEVLTNIQQGEFRYMPTLKVNFRLFKKQEDRADDYYELARPSVKNHFQLFTFRRSLNRTDQLGHFMESSDEIQI